MLTIPLMQSEEESPVLRGFHTWLAPLPVGQVTGVNFLSPVTSVVFHWRAMVTDVSGDCL